jgi:hypothetical protein
MQLKKHSRPAKEFLRANYREQLFSNNEFNTCLKYINGVYSDAVIPAK